MSNFVSDSQIQPMLELTFRKALTNRMFDESYENCHTTFEQLQKTSRSLQ